MVTIFIGINITKDLKGKQVHLLDYAEVIRENVSEKSNFMMLFS